MTGLGRQNSTQWDVGDPMRAVRMEAINDEFDDLRSLGTDRGKVVASKGAQLNACDATTGWVASGTGTALAIDSTKYIEGTGSLKLGASGAGTATYTLTTTATDYSYAETMMLSLWHDFDLQSSITSVTVKIGSDSSNYKHNTITLSDEDYGNWKYRHELAIDSMSDVGSPDMANVDYFVIEYLVTGTIGSGKILIDDIRVSDLAVDIGAFTANVGGTVVNYAGITHQTITASSTNYIMLSAGGSLVINTTGFLGVNAQVAEVVTDTNSITSIAMKRQEIVGGTFGGGTDLVRVESVDTDSLGGVKQVLVGNSLATEMTGSANCAIWFDFIMPHSIEAGADLYLKLVYDMSTAETSKIVQIDMDYWVVSDAGDTTPAGTTGSTSDDISVPNTAETLDIYTATNNKISSANVQPGRLVTVKLTRDVSAGSSHSGKIRIFGIEMYQA